jgi:hypothetical protein
MNGLQARSEPDPYKAPEFSLRKSMSRDFVFEVPSMSIRVMKLWDAEKLHILPPDFGH